MSTQTDAPTTRQLASRVRSALEWIDANADWLPGDWRLATRRSHIELNWYSAISPVAILEVAAALTVHLGTPHAQSTSVAYLTWAPEGARPELTVFLPAGTATEQVTA